MARKRESTDFLFEGFANPTTTPVPDVVFDYFLSRLGEAELKALLYIIRRTFGFKKNHDPISFNQFLRGIVTRDGRVLDEGCGIRDRTTLSRALQSLETKGIIRTGKGRDERGENETTVYSLRFKTDNSEGVVGNSYHPSMNYPPPVVGNSYLQQTGLQETDRQQTGINSNETDIDVFTSNRSNGELSTTLRAQNIVDNRRADGPVGATPRPAAGGRIRDVAPPRPTPVPSEYSPGRGRPPKAPDQLAAAMHEASQKLNDEQPRSSLTRATKLWRASGLPVDKFCQRVYQAMAEARRAKVTKRSAYGDGVLNRAPLFFAELERSVGLRDPRDWSVRTDPPGP